MTDLDLIDFERGTKVAGPKFYFCKNKLVRLNQALINYGMDVLEKHGFELMETPDVAKNEILLGIGFNPRGPETQVYSVEGTDLSLIGTAEITMGGYHANEILDLSKGPKNTPRCRIASAPKLGLMVKPAKAFIASINLPSWRCSFTVSRKKVKNYTGNF